MRCRPTATSWARPILLMLLQARSARNWPKASKPTRFTVPTATKMQRSKSPISSMKTKSSAKPDAFLSRIIAYRRPVAILVTGRFYWRWQCLAGRGGFYIRFGRKKGHCECRSCRSAFPQLRKFVQSLTNASYRYASATSRLTEYKQYKGGQVLKE